jgi:hypothetical protein
MGGAIRVGSTVGDVLGNVERWWLWSNWWNKDWQGKPKSSEKTCSSATFSTTNPTWPDPGSNPGRRVGKPATNRLSYGTANYEVTQYIRRPSRHSKQTIHTCVSRRLLTLQCIRPVFPLRRHYLETCPIYTTFPEITVSAYRSLRWLTGLLFLPLCVCSETFARYLKITAQDFIQSILYQCFTANAVFVTVYCLKYI